MGAKNGGANDKNQRTFVKIYHIAFIHSHDNNIKLKFGLPSFVE